MSGIRVRFRYYTGIKRDVFTRVRLSGSWDREGKFSRNRSTLEMRPFIHEDGCPAYEEEIFLDDSQVDREFNWGVSGDTREHEHIWAIPAESKDAEKIGRYRSFRLKPGGQTEEFYLTHCRRLGANKHFLTPGKPGIRFSVWAPRARAVELVFGLQENGYISDTGKGQRGAGIPLLREADGIWGVDEKSYPPFKDFSPFAGQFYMFKITRSDGSLVYKTDIYSRRQSGRGKIDPRGTTYKGPLDQLDGSVSCSVVVDPEDTPVPPALESPGKLKDLVIYELHVGALGYGRPGPGILQDAIRLLPYLAELGVNAVQLMPLSEFQGNASWGYATSHFLAVEESAGGRLMLKELITHCHKHGILVIIDVVYNHYIHRAERSFWKYDSPLDDENLYYWYEGRSTDYPYDEQTRGHPGGYINNGSSGYAPRYHEENVRKLFLSSAVMLLEEFGIDGFRFDLVSSIHNNNRLQCDPNRLINAVNIFGAKFLREINRTLRLLRADVILIAEDHSQWDRVTAPLDFNRETDDALGFDAVWFMGFYHNLIGDTTNNRFSYARLLYEAGFGENWPLKMDLFAYQALKLSRNKTIVFHESHDEAGNDTEIRSLRTIEVASHFRLDKTSGEYAEARSRFVAGMSLLSAGTPLFFMFEEVRARNKYDHANFLNQREDYLTLKENEGKKLFTFYKELIQFRKNHSAVRSDNLKILHIHNSNRVLVFQRWDDKETLVIAASLNNLPFDRGYELDHYAIQGCYREIFNSDLPAFGGRNTGNGGLDLDGSSNTLNVKLPANGFIVLKQEPGHG